MSLEIIQSLRETALREITKVKLELESLYKLYGIQELDEAKSKIIDVCIGLQKKISEPKLEENN